MTFSGWRWAAILLLALILAAGVGRESRGEPRGGTGASGEPTAEETLLLEYLNRARADPMSDARRIEASAKVERWSWRRSIDWGMYHSEMAAVGRASPLAFDLRVLEAARGHAAYLVRHGVQQHHQDRGKAGFTGVKSVDRMRRAGVDPKGLSSENVFSSIDDAWEAHVGFSVDYGDGGSGGMQEGRGHRKNMHGRGVNTVGCAVVANGEKRCAVQNFLSTKSRFACGVVYCDLNGNEFYDVGEGIGGADVSAGASYRTRTWASGAYTQRLPQRSGRVAISWEVFEASRAFPSGSYNIKLDLVLTVQGITDLFDARTQAVEEERAAHPEDLGWRRLALQLHRTRGRHFVDAARQERVRALILETVQTLEAAQKEVREAIDRESPGKARKKTKPHLATYEDTYWEPWFRDALAIIACKKRWGGMLKRATELTARSRKAALKGVKKLEGKLLTPEWTSYYRKELLGPLTGK